MWWHILWKEFLFALSAIAPILIYMAIGYGVRRFYLSDDAFWKKLNGVVFRVFLSVLLFINIYDIEAVSNVNIRAIFLVVFVIAVLIGAGGIASLFVKKRDQKGVIWQTTYRSNYAVVGIPLAESIGGADAVGFASLVAAIGIPFYNSVSVFLLSFFAHDASGKGKIGKTLLSVLKNPLIVGVLAGLLALCIRSLLPIGADGLPIFSIKEDIPSLYKVLSAMAKAASPIALIVLGARFRFKALKSAIGMLTYGTHLRIVVSFVLTLGIGILADKSGIVPMGAAEYATLVALGGTPVAVSSSVMVSELGGDEALASALVASTSLFSMITLTIGITLLRTFGLI